MFMVMNMFVSAPFGLVDACAVEGAASGWVVFGTLGMGI
jgi:hypothetical protein